jgi:dUTP pyrophosphatase
MVNRPQRIEVKILDERIREWGLPNYHSEEAAGVDLFACVDAPLVIEPQAPAVLVPSGIAIHIGDPQMTALIVPRSGWGHKGLVTGNLVGVVDADFLGPILVSAWNRNGPGSEPIVIGPGDRIAQMLFVPVIRVEFKVVADFTRSSGRGAGGFGSTGESHVPSQVKSDD